MELGNLIKHLQLYYEHVSMYRNELGQPVIYVTKNGVTLTIIIERSLRVVR